MIFLLLLGVFFFLIGLALVIRDYKVFEERKRSEEALFDEFMSLLFGTSAVYVMLAGLLLIIVSVIKM